MLGDLSPTEGSIRRHLHLTIGRYHQHSAEILDLDMTPLEFMQSQFPEQKLEIQDWRQAIGRFGISGPLQTAPIRLMSDGLKSRLIFALLARRVPNLLLLDEPTNHLDIECIDSLAAAIKSFNGGLVLVSHDFRLINQVAKEIWVCDNKSVTHWKGDIRSYKNSLIKTMKDANLI